MSADLLREAAKVLRERVEADGVTPGPWVTGESFGSDHQRMYVLPADPERYNYVSAGGDVGLDDDAAYIATMHPGVGLALADWLDAAAPADGSAGNLPGEWRAAMTVARAILGREAPS